MTIPPVGPDGVRQTVNANLSPAQVEWNVRSALNVAALNCLNAEHAAILPNYTTFLNTHSRALKTTNNDLEKEFRANHGSGYKRIRDVYMTQVYNYFALPPAQANFCDAALAISQDAASTAKGDLAGFAARNLPRLEGVFEDFYRSFEQYRYDLAVWDAQYGTPAYGAPAYAGTPTNTYLSASYPASVTTTTASTNVPTPVVSIPVVESTDGSTTGLAVPTTDPGLQGGLPDIVAPQPLISNYGPVVQPLPGETPPAASSEAYSAPVSGPVVQTLPGASAPVIVDTIDNSAPLFAEPYVAPISGPVVQPLPETDGDG